MNTAVLTPEPWYRQFWPWFVISIPAMTVVACMYTIFLAVTTSDSLVLASPDGIDQETARQLSAEAYAAELGLSSTVVINAETGVVTAEVANLPERFRNLALTLAFQHPTVAGMDREISLLPTPAAENAVFVGTLTSVPQGRWYLVMRQDHDWRVTSTYTGATETRMEPRGAR